MKKILPPSAFTLNPLHLSPSLLTGTSSPLFPHSLPRNVSQALTAPSSPTSTRSGWKVSVAQCTSRRYESAETLWKPKVLTAVRGASRRLCRLDSVAWVLGGRRKGFGFAGRETVREIWAAEVEAEAEALRTAQKRVRRAVNSIAAVLLGWDDDGVLAYVWM